MYEFTENEIAGCLIEKNIDYLGSDIILGVTESDQECAARCLTTTNGNFWTWDPRDKNCYIKNSSSGRKHHSATISGNRECGFGRYLNLFLGYISKLEVMDRCH